jgi:hypothetical protein
MANGHVRRILSVYFQADAGEIRDGLSWYRDARRLAITITGLTPSRAAGIVAALSPNTAWSVNLAIAGRFVATGDNVHTGKQMDKARAILSGRRPLSVLKGPKERPFYANIIRPADPIPVTVDRHAYSIWAGQPETRVPPRLVETVAADYRAAAEILDLLPNQVQAITWIAWRRLHNSIGRTADINNFGR